MIKKFIYDNFLLIFCTLMVIFSLISVSQDINEEFIENKILISEYKKILEYEYNRTFESFEEYIVYRADKILGEWRK